MARWIYLIVGIFSFLIGPPAFGQEIRIAVLDDGFMYQAEQHEWYVTLLGCTERVSACVLGADVAERDSYPFLETQTHGDRMVQTIIQVLQPYVATFGISWKLIPVRIESPNSLDGLLVLEEALRFAQTHGADIISISYGGNTYDAQVASLLTEVQREGIIVVAASGNSPQKAGLYPARYAQVIGVGAWDEQKQRLFAARTSNDILIPAALIPTIPVGSSSATATFTAFLALAKKQSPEITTSEWIAQYTKKVSEIPALYQRMGVFQKPLVSERRILRLSSLESWLQRMAARGWTVYPAHK